MAVVSGISFLRAMRMVSLGSLFAASMATAKEGGLITLTLAGEEWELPLSAGHSDWTGSQGFAEVSIMSRPTEVETWQRFQSFRLSFDLLRTRAETPEISLLRRTDDSAFERWYGRADNGGLTVSITDRSWNGMQLEVSGTFTGALGQSMDFGRTINLSVPMPVSGSFAVTLHPIR